MMTTETLTETADKNVKKEEEVRKKEEEWWYVCNEQEAVLKPKGCKHAKDAYTCPHCKTKVGQCSGLGSSFLTRFKCRTCSLSGIAIKEEEERRKRAKGERKLWWNSWGNVFSCFITVMGCVCICIITYNTCIRDMPGLILSHFEKENRLTQDFLNGDSPQKREYDVRWIKQNMVDIQARYQLRFENGYNRVTGKANDALWFHKIEETKLRVDLQWIFDETKQNSPDVIFLRKFIQRAQKENPNLL